LLFVLFFSVGSAALSLSMLSGELLRYYERIGTLKTEQQYTSQLKSLIADYEAIFQHEKDDPNFVKRIAPAALGIKPDDEDTVYPRVTAELLAAADEVLKAVPSKQSDKQIVPVWVARCSEPSRRIVLFLSGAFLVLVSFIWFGSARQEDNPAQ